MYCADTEAGACAEVFNRGKYRRRWTPEMLRGLPGQPQMVRAIATYEIGKAESICDFDDPGELAARSLRPSDVITRDRERSQAWALRLFQEKRWAGVRWWSYHDARWASFGLWDRRSIGVSRVAALTIEYPALAEAARVLDIQLIVGKRRLRVVQSPRA